MSSHHRVSMKPKALARVLVAFDYLPASQVTQIVERYEAEQHRLVLEKNPRIATLARLPVGGRGVPWPYSVTPLGPGRVNEHLQSMDRYRAQVLLGEPDAKWQLYRPTNIGPGLPHGQLYVRRVR